MVRVCIIGAGCIGLATAFELLKATNAEIDSITIMADKHYDETTSFGSGGKLQPVYLRDTPERKVNKWFSDTYEHFRNLWCSEDTGHAGIIRVTAYNAYERESDYAKPSWSNITNNFKELGSNEINQLGFPEKYVIGYAYDTYIADPKYYMKYLINKLKEKNVQFVREKVLILEDVTHTDRYEVVINCCGIGALDLLGDTDMTPIRGQILRVHAPWIKHQYSFSGRYVTPMIDYVIIGGTSQEGDWDEREREEDSDDILHDVCDVFPSLRTATRESVWVGLRPSRPTVRLDSTIIPIHTSLPCSTPFLSSSTTSSATQQMRREVLCTPYQEQEEEEGKRYKKDVLLVHCYGHGGAGITLSHGCARSVVQEHVLPYLCKIQKYSRIFSRL